MCKVEIKVHTWEGVPLKEIKNGEWFTESLENIVPEIMVRSPVDGYWFSVDPFGPNGPENYVTSDENIIVYRLDPIFAEFQVINR